MPTMQHSAQLDLLGYRPVTFDGFLYRESLDKARLTSQLRRVLFALLDGRWWTLQALAVELGLHLANTTGVSARVRDLRKPRFGGFTVAQRRRPGAEASGIWEYRLVNVRKEQVAQVMEIEKGG